MPFSRLPHMFLSSWVDHKRPQQRPQISNGHGLREMSEIQGSMTRPSQSLGYSIGALKSMACYYSTKECTLQCSRWWLCLVRLRTASSRHRAISAAFALFLCQCPSGTSLHFYALNSVGSNLEIDNRVASFQSCKAMILQ
jgi:hypothetical protein